MIIIKKGLSFFNRLWIKWKNTNKILWPLTQFLPLTIIIWKMQNAKVLYEICFSVAMFSKKWILKTKATIVHCSLFRSIGVFPIESTGCSWMSMMFFNIFKSIARCLAIPTPESLGHSGRLSLLASDHPRTCKWLLTSIYKSWKGHLEGEQPYLRDLVMVVINHLQVLGWWSK